MKFNIRNFKLNRKNQIEKVSNSNVMYLLKLLTYQNNVLFLF